VDCGETRVLVDTSPDLREQLLGAEVERLDAVLYTHAHADHVHGIDDLRAINRAIGKPLDVYGDAVTLDVIKRRFDYVFEPLETETMIYKPQLVGHVVDARAEFRIGELPVRTFPQDHGFSSTQGYRFGSMAYTTDAVELDDHAFEALEGVGTWIIGVFLDRPHPTHADVDKALGWIERIRPKRAVLTHLSSMLDFQELASRLPPGVEPAFDGMVIEAGN